MKQPKDKNIALTPIVEEHDEVILFCERIREGLRNKTENNRIKKYIDWFKAEYLDPHFEIEKKYIFPILGSNNVRVKRALANHRRLKRLFAETAQLNTVFNKIEEELSTYIGFEERVLYNEIKSVATPPQWEQVEKSHQQLKFNHDAWKDCFWEEEQKQS
ncbi:hemerythrin domain-containing protein [Aequorivita marina]|uniref:hemerythrin domain-containing protein n=1 Tax=Aequorivita marina TaxID=3073654 RepID=UPI002875E922|nr:hemerythrin domain-containing protein [Aequorivita sp. S2608]MDS1297161.1 hemerythrin domain-containing protein [Aequorivita sp. S2608]